MNTHTHALHILGMHSVFNSGLIMFNVMFNDHCIVFEFLFLCREGEEGCKKQLGRVLSIWQERAVYENNLLDQLSQVLCKFKATIFTGSLVVLTTLL